MVALLMFAAGFALGLFFGWLLHRERVERAVYEDVARNRDRATAALAETSARLELANKDMIRLRSQLTDVEHELDDRDEAIAELRHRADAAGPPDGDAGDRADVTAEVALAATRVDGAAAIPDTDDAGSAPPPSPSVATPDAADPDAAAPDAADPDAAAPNAAPDVAAPDVADPDAAAPDAADPDVAAPDVADPDAAAPDAPMPDAGDPDVSGIANGDDGPPTAVQQPLASLLDVAPEPPAPEDGTGDEPSSTDQDTTDAPESPEPDDPQRGDLAPDVPAAPEPADAVSGADDDPPIAEPGPDAADWTDEPEPPVTDPRVVGDTPPPPPRDEPAAREPEAPPGRPDPADAIERTSIAPEPVGAEVSSVDASPVDAPDDDVTAPAAITPAAAAPDGAAHEPGSTDDLRQIAGVGPALERALHAEGITTFDQIAALDDGAIAELAARQPRLASRLRRDGWVAQARRLQAGGRRPE